MMLAKEYMDPWNRNLEIESHIYGQLTSNKSDKIIQRGNRIVSAVVVQ